MSTSTGKRPWAPWPINTSHPSPTRSTASPSSLENTCANTIASTDDAFEEATMSVAADNYNHFSYHLASPPGMFVDLPVTPPDSGLPNNGYGLPFPAVCHLSKLPNSNSSPASLSSFSRQADELFTFKKSVGNASPSSSPQPPPPGSSKPSKNDIFNSPSTWITPAPKLKSSPSSSHQDRISSQADSEPKPATLSKNSLFFSASPTPSPPSFFTRIVRRSKASEETKVTKDGNLVVDVGGPALSSDGGRIQRDSDLAHQSSPSSAVTRGHERRPSLGRASTEERERERARIRKSKDIEFRLCPTKEFLLGEGRHCNVYVGAYWVKRRACEDSFSANADPDQETPSESRVKGKSLRAGKESPSPSLLNVEEEEDDTTPPEWHLCAIKRLHADRQSQLLGLDEAFALRRLGPHPNVIRLIDIRDEVELNSSPQATPNKEVKDSFSTLGYGPPPMMDPSPSTFPPSSICATPNLVDPGITSASGQSQTPGHGRSTSDMTGKPETFSEGKRFRHARAAEKEIETARSMGIEVEEMDGDIESVVGRTKMENSSMSTAHRRLASQPVGRSQPGTPMPLVTVANPDGHEMPGSPEAERHAGAPSQVETRKSSDVSVTSTAKTSANPADPPRLLILLELLPHSLSNYSRRHPNHVDLDQWICWAREMAKTVEWLHERGCVHADIKKENMLLTEDLSVKLCDFNSALFPNPNHPPTDGLGLGTPAYGAPELSKATGGPNSGSFSFPIDIFSLGAVLYSLATGVEPFSKARSVIEMVHRKKVFFQSEENDRVARLSVEAATSGASTNGSAPASRNGSIRGRKNGRRVYLDEGSSPLSPNSVVRSIAAALKGQEGGASMRREGSADSIESVASSITTMSGRSPSSAAIAKLLEPSREPRGVLSVGAAAPRTTNANGYSFGGHHRTASLGKGYNASHAEGRVQKSSHLPPRSPAASNGAASMGLGIGRPPNVSAAGGNSLSVPKRPDALRRTSSYGDGALAATPCQGLTMSWGGSSIPQSKIEEATSPPRPSHLRSILFSSSMAASQDGDIPVDGVEGSGRTGPVESAKGDKGWTTEAAAAYSSSGSRAGPSRGPDRSSWYESEGSSSSGWEGLWGSGGGLDEFGQDGKPYSDGNPALILPGGGRLPDEARELLRSMLEADPKKRPTASEVRRILENL